MDENEIEVQRLHDERMAHRVKAIDELHPFNDLSPAEAERLAVLAEEAGEVVQAVCKILRHGYESEPPGGGLPNREYLAREVGDLLGVLDLMVERFDLDDALLAKYRREKQGRMAKYLHHNVLRRVDSRAVTPCADKQ